MSTGPVNYEEAYREKCRVAENTRLALMGIDCDHQSGEYALKALMESENA